MTSNVFTFIGLVSGKAATKSVPRDPYGGKHTLGWHRNSEIHHSIFLMKRMAKKNNIWCTRHQQKFTSGLELHASPKLFRHYQI